MARMKSGWFGESRRHSLASRGIKTGRVADMPLISAKNFPYAKRLNRIMETSTKPSRERGNRRAHEYETDEILTLELDDSPGAGSFYSTFILRNEKTGQEEKLGDGEMVELCEEMWGYDATKNTEASHEEAIKASRFLQNKVGESFNNYVIPSIELPAHTGGPEGLKHYTEKFPEWIKLNKTVSPKKYIEKCNALGERPQTLWDKMQFKPSSYCTVSMEEARELK